MTVQLHSAGNWLVGTVVVGRNMPALPAANCARISSMPRSSAPRRAGLPASSWPRSRGRALKLGEVMGGGVGIEPAPCRWSSS